MSLTYPPFANAERIVKAAQNSPWMKWGESGPGVAILQGALIDLKYPMPRSIKNKGGPAAVLSAGESHSNVGEMPTGSADESQLSQVAGFCWQRHEM